jgi:serpin B
VRAGVQHALPLIAAALVLTSCGSGERELGSGSEPVPLRAEVQRIASPDIAEERVEELALGNNAFAFDVYRAEGGDGNLVFSPYSISLAFSMAYAGARGETEEQTAGVLNYLPQETQHPAFNLLERRISGLGEEGGDAGPAEPFRLNIANAAWGQRGYRFEEAYMRTLAGHYGAGLRALDFGRPEEASEEIKAWISSETQGRIEDLVSPEFLDPATRLVLANAVYFKASWLSRFYERETRNGSFALLDGGEASFPLMRQEMDLPYAEGDGYQAVRLPYEGEKVDMLVLLPKAGRFEEVEGRLNAGFLEDVDQGLRPRYVGLTLPRFDFETDLELPKLLKQMGLTSPFGPGADFSGMTGEKDLFVSDALHRANIAVDERGTEAAAATVLGMAESGAPETVEMIVDGPFFFAITERDTGTILFLGRVTDPSS